VERLAESHNVEVLRKLLESVSRFDPNETTPFVQPDVEFIPIMAALEGRIYHGHEGIERWYSEMRSHWDYFECCPQEFHDLGDRVIAFGYWRAGPRLGGRNGRSARDLGRLVPGWASLSDAHVHRP
jgi:hypothetical protein